MRRISHCTANLSRRMGKSVPGTRKGLGRIGTGGCRDSIFGGIFRGLGAPECDKDWLVLWRDEENDQGECQTLGVRYYDPFLRQENCWYFVERKLVIDWSDRRVSVR